MPASFLGPFGILLNPWVLGAIGGALFLGWVYHKGVQSERVRNARALIELNRQIDDWKAENLRLEAEAEHRLRAAIDASTAIIKSRPIEQRCVLDDRIATAINNIAGK
jgi:hypothetical protein